MAGVIPETTLVVQKDQPLKPFTGLRGNIGKDLSKDSALKDLFGGSNKFTA